MKNKDDRLNVKKIEEQGFSWRKRGEEEEDLLRARRQEY